MNLELSLTLNTEANSRWSTDLNTKTVKLLEVTQRTLEETQRTSDDI